MQWICILTACWLIVSTAFVSGSEPEPKVSAREALRPFNLLIGKWNGSGVPEGTAQQKQQGHWNEVLDWSWKFTKDDAWLVVTFDEGKHFTRGELRALPKPNAFAFKVETADKRTLVFEGTLDKRLLSLERHDDAAKVTERLTLNLLHSNRMTYSIEVKPDGKTFFTQAFRVGATKDGEPLVSKGFNEKECVVSGGQGTSVVTYQGKTYYVCCSGCKEAFNESPEKFVAEFEKKRANFNKK